MKGGTIYKEGNKWIWKSPYYPENGKKKRTRKSFDTYEQALAQRETFYAILKGGEVNNFIEGLTVENAYKKWVENEWKDEETITFNTQRGYANIFKKHIIPYIGKLHIDNLNIKPFSLHLQELAAAGKSQKTLSNIKQALVKLLNYSKERGWIDMNNGDNIIIPRTIKRNRERIVNTLSQTEYDDIILQMQLSCSQYEPVIAFLRHTGIRAEELCIKPEDIDLQKRLITINKAVKRRGEDGDTNNTYLVISKYLKSHASYRVIPLSDEARDALKAFAEWKHERKIKSDYVFCTRTGGLIEQRSILRAFHAACEAADIEKRGLHSLRKLFCKTLKDLPVEWEQVRSIMGHESIWVTQQYYYAMDNDEISEIAIKLSKKS